MVGAERQRCFRPRENTDTARNEPKLGVVRAVPDSKKCAVAAELSERVGRGSGRD